MKKLLSIILSLIMAMSVLVIPATVSAKETKKVPNTYVNEWFNDSSTSGIYIPNKGTVHVYDGTNIDELRFTPLKGKTITLDKCIRDDEGNDRSFNGYYVRGNKVYYCIMKQRKKGYLYQFKTIDINGKNKKIIYSRSLKSSSLGLIGGYGSGVIFSEDRYEHKIDKTLYTYKIFRYNKVTTLFKFYSSGVVRKRIFGGKIFYGQHAYDLATGKTKSFVTKEKYITKNYMYYINKNNNLKSLDKNGTIRLVAKNIYEYLNADDNKSVVYSKLNKDNEIVYYSRTGTDKEVELCTEKDLRNLVGKSNEKLFKVGAVLHKNKVYFSTCEGKEDKVYDGYFDYDGIEYAYIVTVDLKGGTPKVYYEAPYGYDINMWIFNNTFRYSYYDPFDDVVDD